MPAQIRLTEAEAHAFSRCFAGPATAWRPTSSKPIRTAASLRRFASRQTSWSAGSVPIRKRRPDGRRTEGDRRQGWRAPGHPIIPHRPWRVRPDTSAGSQGRGFVQTSGRSGIHLQGQLLSWSGRWVALVVGEVAVELLIWRALGDGVDQVLTAHEGALP